MDALIVDTTNHRYVVRRDDVFGIELVTQGNPLPTEPPRVYVELGALLDPADHSVLLRRRALLVPLRRRLIALLVDHVEIVEQAAATVPLPPLLSARLREPWAIGAVLIDDKLCIQLDLRAVARSAWINVQTPV